MKLPSNLANSSKWTFAGPMGPTVPERLLSHSLLGVDGGAMFLSRMDAWVGDADSLEGAIVSDHIFQFPAEKSQSDLALAMSLLTRESDLELHFWGFLGGRKDHEFLNIGETLQFLESRPQSSASFYNEKGQEVIKCLSQGEWKLSQLGLFSLASLRNIKIRLTGSCKYSLPNWSELPPLNSLGLSNESTGECQLSTQGPVIVFIQGAPT